MQYIVGWSELSLRLGACLGTFVEVLHVKLRYQQNFSFSEAGVSLIHIENNQQLFDI